ncbi:hypothetical protein BLA29_011714, partial [Euroglyphus maynei]
KKTKNRSSLVCDNCGRTGHTSENCWSKRKSSSEKSKKQSESSSNASSPSTSDQDVPKEIASVSKDMDRIVPRQFLRVKIDRKPVVCLLDNGSKISMFPSNWPVHHKEKSIARAANGSLIDVRGESTITIVMKGCSIEHMVYIGNIETPVLGRDFIQKISGDIMHDHILHFSWNNQKYQIDLVPEDKINMSCGTNMTDAEIAA